MGVISNLFGGLLTGLLVFVIIILLIVILVRGYVKAPPDRAIVISGRKKEPRYVIGTSAICIPLLERRDYLTLQVIDINLNTSEPVPTSDFIGVNVDAAINVKVASDDEEKLRAAAQNFLNMDVSQIARIVAPVLEGNVREIVGRMTLKDMVSDRQKFAEEVKASAEPDMNALGLTIKTFNVQNFSDKNGVIDALGVDNEAQIKKDAAVSKARNSQIIREETAKAEQAANQAEVESQTQIADRENELRIRRAALKQESDSRQAEADIAYKLQEETQRKLLEQRTVEADIARQEKEVELEQKRVAVEQQRLEAEISKKADAERYRTEQLAEAELFKRTRDAEAAKIEQQRAADAAAYKAKQDAEAEKARAEAARFAKEQEAAGIEALGRAEAAAIEARGIAEAEAIDRKAEAMQKYGQAAILEMIVNALPEVAREVAAPMASIDHVSIIGGGGADATGMGAYGENVPLMMGKVFQSVKEATGVDLVDIVSGEGAKARMEYNVHVTPATAEAVSEVAAQVQQIAAEEAQQ